MGNGMMFRHKPFVTLIKKLNNIEQGMGELYRDNFKRENDLETVKDDPEFSPGKSPPSVLITSFKFEPTPEGHKFWMDIYHKLMKEEKWQERKH